MGAQASEGGEARSRGKAERHGRVGAAAAGKKSPMTRVRARRRERRRTEFPGSSDEAALHVFTPAGVSVRGRSGRRVRCARAVCLASVGGRRVVFARPAAKRYSWREVARSAPARKFLSSPTAKTPFRASCPLLSPPRARPVVRTRPRAPAIASTRDGRVHVPRARGRVPARRSDDAPATRRARVDALLRGPSPGATPRGFDDAAASGSGASPGRPPRRARSLAPPRHARDRAQTSSAARR